MKPPLHPSPALPAGSALYALERHSFSDEAAREIARRHPGLSVQNVDGIQAVQRAVGEGHHGLIPIENSSGGLVVPHVEWLKDQAVSILLDIRHRISMCAGGLPGGSLGNADAFLSHPKGFDQCSKLLARYPHAKQIPFHSTAAAAKAAAVSNDRKNVALASRSALAEAGLAVFSEDVANHSGSENITQFYVVRKNGDSSLPDPGALYHAAILTPEDELGALHRILGMIKEARVNLTSIHSRPIGMKQYSFFIEMERRGTKRQCADLARDLGNDRGMRSLRWLGSWSDRIED